MFLCSSWQVRNRPLINKPSVHRNKQQSIINNSAYRIIGVCWLLPRYKFLVVFIHGRLSYPGIPVVDSTTGWIEVNVTWYMTITRKSIQFYWRFMFPKHLICVLTKHFYDIKPTWYDLLSFDLCLLLGDTMGRKSVFNTFQKHFGLTFSHLQFVRFKACKDILRKRTLIEFLILTFWSLVT